MPPTREHVVVVGGGAAGMFAALLLARGGARVTLLDKDPTPLPTTLAEIVAWARPGVPHAGHSHAFLARFRSLLADHLPDVLDALLDAGARELRLPDEAPATLVGAAPADSELVVLGARRSLLDWVLRRAVAAQPGVVLRTGADARVTGVVTRPVHAVEGVRFADGSRLDADLVVDAAGRLSRFGDWLAEAGVARPAETSVPCGIAYYSRFYRRADPTAALPTALNRGHTVGASFDRYSCLAFPSDNDTFSITFGVLPEDTALRVLRHGAGFDAAARSVPMVAPWLDEPGVVPLGEVAVMSGLRNRVRPWTVEGCGAVVTGLLPVGDAALITNPAHTRGTTLALLSAVRLAAAVAETTDAEQRSAQLAANLRAEFLPWFEDSCRQDIARVARWRAGGTTRPPDPVPVPVPPQPSAAVSNSEAYLASTRDPVVWHAFARLQNLLTTPESVLADAAVVARVRAVLSTGWSLPRTPAPSHDDVVATASDAAQVAAEPAARHVAQAASCGDRQPERPAV